MEIQNPDLDQEKYKKIQESLYQKNQNILKCLSFIDTHKILSLSFYKNITNIESYLQSQTYDILYNIHFLNNYSRISGKIDMILHSNILKTRFKIQENLDYPYYMMICISSDTINDYHIIKNAANLYYVQKRTGIHLEPTHFYVYNIKNSSIHKIFIQDYISSIKSSIRNLRRILNFSTLYEKETMGPLLYPNMKLNSNHWNKFKSEFATEIGELTMIWQITNKHKQIAYSHNIYSWKDTRFNASLVGLQDKKKHIVDSILNINRQSSQFIHIDSPFPFRHLFHNHSDLYVDFEYTNQYLYLIGIVYKEKYISLWASELSIDAEKQLLLEFQTFLISISNDSKIWYWFAEKNKYIQKCNQHNLSFSLSNWYDLHYTILNGTIVFKNAFDFKLKSIVNALYISKQIDYNYSELDCSNGEESIQMAFDYYQSNNINIKQKIQIYNKMDCCATRDIYFIIKNNLQ
jgi:hypothetical protein